MFQFLDVEDIPLNNPPLSDVISQIRFPPILKIAQDEPVAFQESIRDRFPELRIQQQAINIAVSMGSEQRVDHADASPRLYRFSDASGGSLVTLASDSLALSTSDYSVWENFSRDLELVTSAAIDCYEIPYAKRIGLRYVNALNNETAGIQTIADLVNILQAEIASLVVTDSWEKPDEFVTQVLLSDGSVKLVIRLGTNTVEDPYPTAILDFDCYEEGREIPLTNLLDRFEEFHNVIYRAFRWTLQDEAMEVFQRESQREE